MIEFKNENPGKFMNHHDDEIDDFYLNSKCSLCCGTGVCPDCKNLFSDRYCETCFDSGECPRCHSHVSDEADKHL